MRLCLPLTALLLGALCASATAQDRPERERTVYVPIGDFDRIFAKERGGVFVPYDELQRLVKRARANEAPTATPIEAGPPTDYLLVGADLRGEAGERVVQFTATFDIEVLEDDAWVVVPIGLDEASLEEVHTTGGQRVAVGPMSLLARKVAALNKRAAPALPTGGYGIILRGAGRVQTTAKFALPIDSSQPGRNNFQLSLPRTALARFEVTLPQSGLAIKVTDAQGHALATEATSVEGKDQTKVRAYFGAGAHAKVSWNPRPKEEAGITRDPLLFAKTETALRMDEGVLQTTTRIDYRILQAPCGEFKVGFPNGYTLLGVSGENMSAYPTPVQGEGGQVITVRLHEKAKENYFLEVRLEKILEDGMQRLAFPRIATVGTERESGVLAARTSEFLTLEPDRLRGLSQIDASALTPTLISNLKWNRRGRSPLVFRYLRQPYGLNLKTSEIKPEVDGQVLTLATIRDQEIGLDSTVRYTIKKRGIFGVRLRLPMGARVLKCGDERTVKDWRVEKPAKDATEKNETLVVDFVGQRQGTFNLPLLVQIPRTPQPDEGEVMLSMPRLMLLDVKKETGVLAVGGQRHLEVSLVKGALRGLVQEAVRRLPQLGFQHRAQSGEDITFGYKYLKAETVAADFKVKKRESKVTAKVETLVDAQEDRIKVNATVLYTVEYAGVEQVRIEVPEALGSKKELHFDQEGLKDQVPVIKDGKATWTITLQGKRLGTFPVKLNYDIKLDNFKAGDRKEVPLHEIKVLDCFSETGDIALKKHENLVVSEVEMASLEKRDKRELPDSLRRQEPIQAYRYVSHPHKLVLEVTKYDFKAPLGMLISHLHHDEVVEGDGGLKAEAILLLQNNAEQYLTVLLPKSAEMKGLKVDGQTEEWSEGELTGGRPSIQVHLGEVTKTRRDKPFKIRLRYDVPLGALSGTGGVDLSTLRFPLEGDLEVPVARLTRALYLPTRFKYLSFDSDATKHFNETSLWEELKESLGIRASARKEGWSARQEAQNSFEVLIARVDAELSSGDMSREEAQRARRQLVASARELQNGILSGGPRGNGAARSWEAGKRQAESAIVNLKRHEEGAGAEGGIYPRLELPLSRDPYLFEKLDNPSRLSVRYASWSLYYLLDLLAFLAVIGLGVALTSRKLVGAVPYVAVAGGAAVLGAAFMGRAYEDYFTSALLGTTALGGFFLVRALWREATVLRHERRLAELAREAEVARERAAAASAESRLRGQMTVEERPAAQTEAASPDPKAAPADGKKAATSAEDQAAADKIKLDEGGSDAPAGDSA